MKFRKYLSELRDITVNCYRSIKVGVDDDQFFHSSVFITQNTKKSTKEIEAMSISLILLINTTIIYQRKKSISFNINYI